MLEIINADCGYISKKREKHTKILTDVSLSVKKGEILCILGSNGIGKTTLFKTILGALPLIAGSILIDGKEFHQMSAKEKAAKIAYVPQAHSTSFSYTVLEMVLMGRAAYIDMLRTPSKEDVRIAKEALIMLGLEELADSIYAQISGGEQQMVLIARAMAQQAQFLLLDEPTSNLDLGNQTRVLKKLKELGQSGIGIIFTTHNPNHAFLCDAQTVIINRERKIEMGKAFHIIDKECIRNIYDIESEIVKVKDYSGETVNAVIPFL